MFIEEARRVAPELIVVDSAQRPDGPLAAWQDRVLSDGSTWQVYKRWFTAASLAGELGGAETLLDGDWFVAVTSARTLTR